MGTVRKWARKIDDAVIQPVVKTVENIVENPAALAGVALAIAAPGVGTAIGSTLGASGAAATAIGNAVIGGTLAEASGGDFLKGAITGGVGSLVAPVIKPTFSQILGGGTVGNIGASALTGGALSALQGGDFVQGALTGGVLGGIDQTINQIKSYSAYTPNADGTYTFQWDDGSTITIDKNANIQGYTPSTDVFNYVDTQSRATQDVSGKLAALGIAKTLTPYAITALLSKSAYDKATKDEQGDYRYPIIPVPTDWKSPEYNMAFTPSAPIDFGTRELLRGTQWETPQITEPNQYKLENLINTLNMESVPFVQQNYDFNPVPLEVPDILQKFNVAPTVAATDVIGNLNNQPVSIADIIAGIQSGQNYSS